MQILAIDPGRTTGICLVESASDGLRLVEVREILWDDRFDQLKALLDSMFLHPLLQEPQPVGAVVIETFRLRQGRAYEQSGSDFPSTQVIAIVQTLLWVRDPFYLTRLFYQEPAIIGRVKILDEHVNYVAGSEHKKDAYRHARFFYLAHGRKETA